MSEYNAGSARASYILDISQPKQAAAELRALFAGLRESTTAPQAAFAPAGVQAYAAGLREVAGASSAAASPTQALIESIRAEGQALGQTDEQISAHIAALSREALALGDVTRANELQAAALGETDAQQTSGTAKSLQRTQAEARAAVAARDYAGALRLLSGELAGQGERTIGVINAERQLIQTQNQATAAAEREALVEQRQADTAIRVAQQRARAAVATKDYAGALQILNTAQTENAGSSALASLETQIAQTEAAGTATGAFGAELAGLLSPLALATVGFGALASGVKSFGDALHNQGQIAEERTAFGGIIGGFARGNAVLDDAIQRTRAYGFTAKETTDAFRALAPVIRESTSTTKDQAEALARISVLEPDKPVQALTSAIEGIKTGRFRELSKELGLSADEQKRLKDQVDGGKDAFLALNDVLDRHGITLKVAAERMDGYAGAERRAQQAGADFERAQADLAQGPGVAFVQSKTIAYRALIDLLNSPGARNPLGFGGAIGTELVRFAAGEDRARDAINAHTGAVLRSADADDRAAAAIAPVIDMEDRRVQAINRSHQASVDALRDLIDGVNRSAQASAADSAAKEAQQAKTALVAAQDRAATDAFLALNPRIDEAGIFSLIAAGKINPLIGQIALLRLQAQAATGDLIAFNNAQNQKSTDQAVATGRFFGRGSGRGGGSDAAADSAAFVGVLQKQNQEQQKLIDSEIALAGAKKQTAKEIELLRQKQSQYAKGTAEFNSIEAQIVGIQQQSSKTRVSAAQSTALQLQNVEENSGLQLLKTQRENLERLRDQEQDFTLKRVRSKEDEDEKIRGLLARGQIAAAARERADFAKQQKRDQEDFDIQRQRTLRNNAEATGDIGNRTDLRTEQIDRRAALRGVRTNGGAALGNIPLPDGGVGGGASGPRVIQITLSGIVTTPDGQKLADITYPFIAARIDDDLSIELRGANPPGANQTAVSGSRP